MFQPRTWQYFFFTFFIHQFHLQYASVTIEVTHLYRMKPGFQCLLHNNLHRRMCSIIISQQFTVEHQCATVVRKKGKCIDTIGRNFQIAGQHQTDISFTSSGIDTDSTTYSPLTGAASISAQRLPRKSCHTAFKPDCKAAGAVTASA